MIGDLVDLPNEINERFSFKEPAPDMLYIHPVTGVVRLKQFNFEYVFIIQYYLIKTVLCFNLLFQIRPDNQSASLP